MTEHKYYVHTPTGIKAECINYNDSQVILKMKGKNTTIGNTELKAYWKPITKSEFWSSCPATTSENASKIEETPQNVKDFTDICNKMVLTYKAKNHDYGNSFHNTFKKYGIVSALTRMSDKFNRLDTLYNKNDNKVNESIEDTLLDLANYAVMTLVELRDKKIRRPMSWNKINVDVDPSFIEELMRQYFMNIDDATPIMEDVLSYFTESELIKTRKMIDTILHDEYEN